MFKHFILRVYFHIICSIKTVDETFNELIVRKFEYISADTCKIMIIILSSCSNELKHGKGCILMRE